MTNLPFLKLEHYQKAQHLEGKLVELLPEFSGALFVSVTAIATLPDEDTIYKVFVGCAQDALVDALTPLVTAALIPWSRQGYQLEIDVRRGQRT